MTERLGSQIREARERRGWTQQALAEQLGVKRKTVVNWETGKTSPQNKLGAIHAVLKIGQADEKHQEGITLDIGDDILAQLSDLDVRRATTEAEAAFLRVAQDAINRNRWNSMAAYTPEIPPERPPR